MKIAINVCYGGFSISAKACEMLKQKYNVLINPEYGFIDDVLERHDPRLIDVIETLGVDSFGSSSKLKIEQSFDDCPAYKISDYDGLEDLEFIYKSDGWHFCDKEIDKQAKEEIKNILGVYWLMLRELESVAKEKQDTLLNLQVQQAHELWERVKEMAE